MPTNQSYRLDDAIGQVLTPEAAKAILAANAHKIGVPNIAAACRKLQGNKGIIRVRADWRYDTVFLQWDAAGVAPTIASAILYAIPKGQADPATGVSKGVNVTNSTQAGKMDQKQEFIAPKMGFDVQVDAAGLANLVNRQLAVEAAKRVVGATFETGTETSKDWQSIGDFPLPRSNGNPDAVNTRAQGIGEKDVRVLSPPIVLGAGESFGIELRIGAGLPGGVGFESLRLGIFHEFAGRSRTGVQG